MILTINEYLSRMVDLGYYSEKNLIPELNSKVWQQFLALTIQYAKKVNQSAIYFCCDKYGFFYNPFGESLALEWALGSYFCHSHLPYNLYEIVKDSSGIISSLSSHDIDAIIQSETFTFKNNHHHNEEYANYFLWLNSPIVAIPQTFNEYLTSLSSSRRNKIKKTLAHYHTDKIQYYIAHDTLNEIEFDFAMTQLVQKWQEESPYAITQLLWSIAVAKVMPQQVLWLRIFLNQKLIAISHYIVKDNSLYHQGIIKEESVSLNNIGTFAFVATIKLICGLNKYLWLDPTCKTGLIEDESIDFYKRSVVNCNATKPIYRTQIKEINQNTMLPIYSAISGWHITDEKIVLFRPV